MKMLITKLFNHKQEHMENKNLCSVYKAVSGTHFVKKLISELAHQHHVSIMTDWHYKGCNVWFVLGTLRCFQAIGLPIIKKPFDLNHWKCSWFNRNFLWASDGSTGSGIKGAEKEYRLHRYVRGWLKVVVYTSWLCKTKKGKLKSSH